MKKNLIQIMCLLLISLFLAACGSNADKTATASKGNASDGKGETVKIKLGTHNPEDHPATQAAYDFAEKVKERTDGRIEIDLFPSSQLGDYTTVYEEVTRGTIEMSLSTMPSLLDSRLDISFMPYLVENYSKLEESLGPDSYVFNKLKELNAEQNVEFLSFHVNGFGGVGTAKEVPNIAEIDQPKDLLIRTAPSDIYKLPWEAIGFRTVTIPYADLYTSLQTGAADGWAGGEPSLNYFGFRDVIKYFYTTNDFINADSLIINKNVFEGFSEEDQNTIKELATELMYGSFKNAEENDNKYMKMMEDEGITVVRLSAEEISKLANHVREVSWPKLESQMGADIIKELQEEYLNK
ncbi:TRAP transporter substrate-binding protein DctP [Schinkia azotoformans]|uniref:TRAP transporter substrate-binding protein DctP n=1 Tax=Schinkia azotoformans TaxID=1454 RepID=UPI002DC03541|nr:TRAP transporter substrate-binding protein DctP [Schinkia azotoformans]MEC1715142.1 TRAP transporter substrate-binding protein DctP [Schinkia azotoformans]MEC1739808.1 TRAP transporter substrate-binding protein DctP [Schinkia azotoformans]MEC1745567.1 TRAP transporter substrate-binding protein DctP [Schinkia azotoformans]MEC1760050.1 TRAP transporter substrate-binding protein DctP [Schinkia azotoformans]MEC1765067.1 TRAP transporter substrate-binding protein DctP [Schinkia azotoformans]